MRVVCQNDNLVIQMIFSNLVYNILEFYKGLLELLFATSNMGKRLRILANKEKIRKSENCMGPNLFLVSLAEVNVGTGP